MALNHDISRWVRVRGLWARGTGALGGVLAWDRNFLRRMALLGGACLLVAGLWRLLASDLGRDREAQRRTVHSYQLLDATRTLLATLRTAEESARNYVLMGDQRYLAAYQAAMEAEPAARQAVGRLTAGNAEQQLRLDALDGLIAARLGKVGEGVQARLAGRTALYQAGEGTEYLERIRAALHSAEAEDRGQLAQQAAAAEAEGWRMRWLLGAGSAGLLALLATAWGVIEHDMRQRERLRRAIEEKGRALARSEDAAQALAESANKEMSAFAYSVTHDLRAPLRGIDGWSKALELDCGDQLDARGREYLARVRAETAHLGDLIDRIVGLLRITQTEMHRGTVDLSALANAVASRLRKTAPGRELEFQVAGGLTASGDAGLLEVALTQLLDNAVKFTRPRPRAQIEFGRQDSAAEDVFYVRDNGVGFDMAYAGGLFGAFQRMHKASEFPGAGLGLAAAQRVIRRHGGRIWADAAPEKGAAFYFTIGGKR